MARLPSAFEELADLTWALANDRLEAEAVAPAATARLGCGQSAGIYQADKPVRRAGMGGRQRAPGTPPKASPAPRTSRSMMPRRPGAWASPQRGWLRSQAWDVVRPSLAPCPLPLGPSRLESFGGPLLGYAIVAVALVIGAVAAWVWTSAAVRSPATVAQHDRQQVTAFKNTAEPRVVTPAGGRPATAATGAAAPCKRG